MDATFWWRGPVGVYAHSGAYDNGKWFFNDVISPEDYADAARRWPQPLLLDEYAYPTTCEFGADKEGRVARRCDGRLLRSAQRGAAGR